MPRPTADNTGRRSVAEIMQHVRFYLRNSDAQSEEQLMQDAVVLREPGAVAMLWMLLQVRANKRTRRSVKNVTDEWVRA